MRCAIAKTKTARRIQPEPLRVAPADDRMADVFAAVDAAIAQADRTLAGETNRSAPGDSRSATRWSTISTGTRMNVSTTGARSWTRPATLPAALAAAIAADA